MGIAGEGQQDGEADEGEGDEEDAAELWSVEKRGGGATLVDRRVVESNGADDMVEASRALTTRTSGQRGKLQRRGRER